MFYFFAEGLDFYYAQKQDARKLVDFLQTVVPCRSVWEQAYLNSLWPGNAIFWQEIWVNIGSCNGLLPDGTKPLLEPVLTYHQSCLVAFTGELMNFICNMLLEIRLFKITTRVQWVNKLVRSSKHIDSDFRYQMAQELISHDIHNNTYNYKFTFSVELIPVCKDDVVCLPPKLAQQSGNMGQICICQRVTSSIQLIDPNSLQGKQLHSFNSLAPGKFESNFRYIIFK